jgi:hypothetical protein
LNTLHLPLWTESRLCQSQHPRVCRRCGDPNDHFLANMARNHRLPGATFNFQCPHGVARKRADMKLYTFSLQQLIDRANTLPKPAAYWADLKACAVGGDASTLTVDIESDCYKAMRAKYPVFDEEKAVKKRNGRQPAQPPAELAALAEKRAVVCGNCQHVTRDDKQQPVIHLTQNGWPIFKVGCATAEPACNCKHRKLIGEDCPIWTALGLSTPKSYQENPVAPIGVKS